MKHAKLVEKCLEQFDDNACQLTKGHYGKHRDNRDRSVSWTDAGKARVLAERASEKQQAVEVTAIPPRRSDES